MSLLRPDWGAAATTKSRHEKATDARPPRPGGLVVAATALLGFAIKRREGRFVVGHSGLEPEANGLRRVPAARTNGGYFRHFWWSLVTRGWDREGQEGTRGDSLYAIVVHVVPMDPGRAA